MSKRLILGSTVIAGLTAVALWTQSPLAAQAQTAPETVASKAQTTVPGGNSRTEAAYEDYIKDGVVRKVLVYRDVEEQPTATIEPNEAKTTPSEYRIETEAEAKNSPRYHGQKPGQKQFVREVPVIEKNGVVRKTLEVTNVETLQERYLDLHRRIAERLTPEQLAQKYNALEKELNEILAEDEIEQIQKQLSELKRKNSEHKGVSTRVQRAIEALKNTHSDVGAKEL